MTDIWEWNDDHITKDQVIFRHVPKEPGTHSPKKRIDPTNGQWSLTKAAFTKDEILEDGWSIHREKLMKDRGITVSNIEESGSAPREAWRLLVANVRSVPHSGVIDKEDPNDEQLGKAHGLIRCESPKPTNEHIVRLRTQLIAHARPA